ncbi:MAG: hypothetical protein PF487_11445 [Bacteroidales bacterium]|jgi:hypothetical protein|nr:hypothetical protein [Bacteroidales bacterium]
MVNKKEYLILDNKSLIIESYSGTFHVDELIEFKIKVSNDKIYNPNFNVIHDFRKFEFLSNIEEISKYIDLISKNKKLLGNRKSVMITETPNQVVTSMGFDLLKKKLPIYVKVCSTFETVFNFIGIPKNDWKFVESLINSLKE